MNDFVFILGIGRSGTTFLARLISKTSTRTKFISEPFPGIIDFQDNHFTDPNFIEPFNKARINHACELLQQLRDSNRLLWDAEKRVERDDEDKSCFIVKEVHGLLAFPEIKNQLSAKVVVITRDTSRVLDSYFYGHTRKQRIHLVEEYHYFRKQLKNSSKNRHELLDAALNNVSNQVIKYLKKPKLIMTEFMKQACITELMRQYLLEWASRDKDVIHVTHEDLSINPMEKSKSLFSFLELDYNDDTIQGIEQMTTGNATGYYETQKNSRQILAQKYKSLTEKEITELQSLLR